MAPATRRSQSGAIARKASARKPATRNTSSSWQFQSINDHDDSSDEGGESVRESTEVTESHPNRHANGRNDGAMDVEEAVKPLREMADKVGREVERFAEAFDQFISELPMQENKYEAAKEVVLDFKFIAEDAANELRRNYQRERMEQLRKEWSQRAQLSANGNAATTSLGSKGSIMSGIRAEKVQELRQWQQEADIWRLFSFVLDFWYNQDARRKTNADQLASLPSPHRFTKESDLWDRFLLSNEIAMEHSVLKEWLEQTADHQETDLQGIMQELEARSGVNGGSWNKGWLSTREKIKGQKRVRSWPDPSESVLPQIRSSSNDILVATLDPDAPARQGRKLEAADQSFERAVWIACWEMIRRGKPWEEILAWCQERNEGWRAAILAPTASESEALSNIAWRKMCYLASETPCSCDHEAAVYGLLGGNVKAAQKVCRTTDDHLFAYYSCTLVRQFDLWLQNNFASRVPSLAVKRKGVEDVLDQEGMALDLIADFINQLRNADADVKEDSLRPFKIIESYLLLNDAEGLAMGVGVAISDLDQLRGGHEEAVMRVRPPPEKLPVQHVIALNSHALRVATHIWLVVMAIEMHFNQEGLKYRDQEENVLVAYVQALRFAGKRELAPAYAARLQPARAVVTMSRVLQDVSRPEEQETIVRLMGEVGISVQSVLVEQLRWVLEDRFRKQGKAEPLFKILEDCEVSKLHPGRRIINGSVREELTPADIAVVQCLGWFQLVKGHWALTFKSLAQALQACLMAGRLACAMQIIQEYPYDVVSENKSAYILGRGVNVMDSARMPDDPEEAARWQVLQRQSRTYYELEQLVRAIEALAYWAAEERPLTGPVKQTSSAPSGLREAKAHLDREMAPLLEPGILMQPTNEEEKAKLDEIRYTYLPDIIIAYSTALYTAGPTLSRDAYIESMDLSVTIASNESNGLSEALVHENRMRELVQTFAEASKMMLIMKNEGRGRKVYKNGKDLELWAMSSQGSMAGGDFVHVDGEA